MEDSDKNIISEIEVLLKELDNLRMGDIHSSNMETKEKRLNARIGYLISNKLFAITGRLEGLGAGISQLNQSIRDGIKSNEVLAKQNEKYTAATILWTKILAVATLCLVGVGFWQGYLINTYTKETQQLSRVAREQLDLQLQPALIIRSYGLFGSSYKNLSLVNLGNGAAFNINISSKEKLAFARMPEYLEAKSEERLYFIDTNKVPSKFSPEDLNRMIDNNVFDFSGDIKELRFRIEYENINNRRYFTEITVSPLGVKLISRGEVNK